ncbi:MAG TPA: glycoside hydrolase family 13 protein [Candidatus Ozemobacteraceae bacterium]|nr:glycoside hydrolase family 13 protein [Candidatus Ozemobacteraceae bacterium]
MTTAALIPMVRHRPAGWSCRSLRDAVLYALAFFLISQLGGAMEQAQWMNSNDRERAQVMRQRAVDWRNGAIVYQILVDRFAPSTKLEKKRGLYKSPRRLRNWQDLPTRGTYNRDAAVWSQEIDFWGGDLDSLMSKLDYLQELGVEVVYLNPIFLSLTNHKYDAWDYHQVDPMYGTRKDVGRLAKALHERGMKLMLDGVFNHMGRQSPMFQEALRDEKSRYREFFLFTPRSRYGYIGWNDVENLPELNLDSQTVRDYLYAKPDSVVQSYLRQEKIDGWRLDVAFDLGFTYLSELTEAAHAAKPGCSIIGEIWNYPEEWRPAVDAVMNMHGRRLILGLVQGKLSGPLATEQWQTLCEDAGIDHLLQAWLVLDNHDVPRLAHVLPQFWQQKMARVLQFTLPGSVNLYYGSEVGMEGGDDPEQRAPMRWDLITPDNQTYQLHKALLRIRKQEPALRYGDYRRLASEKLFTFSRRTASIREAIFVIANPTARAVTEILSLREGKIMSNTPLRDLLSDRVFNSFTGTVEVTVPAHDVLILKPDCTPFPQGYSRYDRVY